MVTAKKLIQGERLVELIKAYPTVLSVTVDNVGSRQFSEIRFALRGMAHIIKAKNTMVRTVVKQLIDETGNQKYQKLIDLAEANCAFVFCIAPVAEVRQIVLNNRVPAPARAGVIAPISVTIPAGPTTLEPSQTSFFQALSINTKIVKAKIEILSDVHLMVAGDKVGPSEAALLQKMDIKPFTYGFLSNAVYDDGDVYPASVLDITSEVLVGRLSNAISNVAAFGRATGIPSRASVPHSIMEAFKNACAMCIDSEFKFEQLEDLLASASAAPVAATESSPAAAKEEEKKEESEESSEGGFGGMFD
eukprot:GHVH01007432.1.p1 GENE.GHVH01007432.1~~GHVH01007432.1.p1  ORF type:complete len:305 (+),score=75.17 GHVH01007432.1:69-983(+)